MDPEALLIVLIVYHSADFPLVTQGVTFAKYGIVWACEVLPEIDIANASYRDVRIVPEAFVQRTVGRVDRNSC
jgi:hypothetical protein